VDGLRPKRWMVFAFAGAIHHSRHW
jgi:hypothetical protein